MTMCIPIYDEQQQIVNIQVWIPMATVIFDCEFGSYKTDYVDSTYPIHKAIWVPW